jgi:NAD(P)-dependent dehydrogenase (short-subunit alcohol dehydrogenase family)
MTGEVAPPRSVVILRGDGPIGRAVADRLRRAGERVHPVPGDPRAPSVRRDAFEAALRSTGRLDAVVFAPAAGPPSPDDAAAELRAAFFGVQDAARIMTGGRIVVSGPASGDAAGMLEPATMVEGAFVALVRLLAVELAPLGIALNALCPIAREAAVESVGAALAFLASDDATYMTGACIPISTTSSFAIGVDAR